MRTPNALPGPRNRNRSPEPDPIPARGPRVRPERGISPSRIGALPGGALGAGVRALLGLGWLAFLAALLVRAARGELPLWARRIHAQPLGDDLAHVLVAVGTTVALAWLLPGRRARVPGAHRPWPPGPTLAFALLTLEELSQGWLAERVLSPQDLLASWVGVGLGVALLRGLGEGASDAAPDATPARTSDAQRGAGGTSVHARGASMRSTG